LTVVERLLQNKSTESTNNDNLMIRLAVKENHFAIVGKLLRYPGVYLPANLVDRIEIIRSRCTEVCNALQELELPALLTLGILDELIPNEIRMWAKWELVTTVKHFHQRQAKKKLLLLK
jgi:hypothetical protein